MIAETSRCQSGETEDELLCAALTRWDGLAAPQTGLGKALCRNDLTLS